MPLLVRVAWSLMLAATFASPVFADDLDDPDLDRVFAEQPAEPAVDPGPSLPAPAADSERLADLEKKFDELLKKSEEEKAQKPATVKEELKPEEVWVDLSTEKWTVKLGGHVQMDYINWATASDSIPDTKDYFEFRRLRLVADGTGYGIYDFRLQATLEPETVGESGGAATSPDVKDAYFTMNEIPWLGRWRIGNFFVPFSLEQVTNDTNNIFLERSIPSQGVFSGDREVGMACTTRAPTSAGRGPRACSSTASARRSKSGSTTTRATGPADGSRICRTMTSRPTAGT